MANAIKVFDANEMKRRLNSHMASAIFKGVANISMGKDSSSATEFMRGYERGAIDTANIALGTRLVDAVEVVRCKNCKSCQICYPEKQIGKEATPGWYCKEHKRYRSPDDFCSYGERREGE